MVESTGVIDMFANLIEVLMKTNNLDFKLRMKVWWSCVTLTIYDYNNIFMSHFAKMRDTTIKNKIDDFQNKFGISIEKTDYANCLLGLSVVISLVTQKKKMHLTSMPFEQPVERCHPAGKRIRQK